MQTVEMKIGQLIELKIESFLDGDPAPLKENITWSADNDSVFIYEGGVNGEQNAAAIVGSSVGNVIVTAASGVLMDEVEFNIIENDNTDQYANEIKIVIGEVMDVPSTINFPNKN